MVYFGQTGAGATGSAVRASTLSKDRRSEAIVVFERCAPLRQGVRDFPNLCVFSCKGRVDRGGERDYRQVIGALGEGSRAAKGVRVPIADTISQMIVPCLGATRNRCPS